MDELLEDLNLPKRESPEMIELLRTCSPGEQAVIKELVAAIKPVLHKLDL